MNTLIVYDSMFGNTEKIAESMAGAFALADTKVIKVTDATQEDLGGIDLLIVGSPTHGGRAKPSTQVFLDAIKPDALAGVRVAAFDTRFEHGNHNIFLRLLMKVIDFAAPRIAKTLVAKGGQLATDPEGFIVIGKQGPLKEGELERALQWAKQLA